MSKEGFQRKLSDQDTILNAITAFVKHLEKLSSLKLVYKVLEKASVELMKRYGE